MATYDAVFHQEAFEEMEAHRKTVYTLIALDEFRFITSGDRLEFGSHGSITIGMVRRYPSLESLVEVEGWQCLIPDASSADDAINQVRKVQYWDAEAEAKCGVLSLRVRGTHRKVR